MTSAFLKYAGPAASVLLIAFGVGAIATGLAAAVKVTDLASIAPPTRSGAGKPVRDGASAKCLRETTGNLSPT